MFLLIMFIAGIGFLNRFVLIPGAYIWNNGVAEFLGYTRREWSSLHFILSMFFLLLTAIHIMLHLKTILCLYEKMIPGKTLRRLSAILIITTGLLLISFPLIISAEFAAREPLPQNKNNKNTNVIFDSSVSSGDSNQPVLPQPVKKKEEQQNNCRQCHHEGFGEFVVEGSGTLLAVSDRYDVPVNKVAEDLKIPLSSAGEKLDSLKKKYQFTFDDVVKSISKYHGR